MNLKQFTQIRNTTQNYQLRGSTLDPEMMSTFFSSCWNLPTNTRTSLPAQHEPSNKLWSEQKPIYGGSIAITRRFATGCRGIPRNDRSTEDRSIGPAVSSRRAGWIHLARICRTDTRGRFSRARYARATRDGRNTILPNSVSPNYPEILTCFCMYL